MGTSNSMSMEPTLLLRTTPTQELLPTVFLLVLTVLVSIHSSTLLMLLTSRLVSWLDIRLVFSSELKLPLLSVPLFNLFSLSNKLSPSRQHLLHRDSSLQANSSSTDLNLDSTSTSPPSRGKRKGFCC